MVFLVDVSHIFYFFLLGDQKKKITDELVQEHSENRLYHGRVL